LDPRARLTKAQEAAAAGRHAEALRGYEWFHRNALKHRPSLYGVRLSFALSYWTELGKVYPKALRSLERIRRDKTAALRNGRGNRETFHDVVSINEHLNKQRDTYRLFRNLDAKRPALAAACASVAMPALVRCRDFKLARRHMPDPDALLSRHLSLLKEGMEWSDQRPRKWRAASREAHIRIYCKDVALLTAILRGSGERGKAAELSKQALALAGPSSLRNLVAARLR
jgi:hypothetical protein